MKNLSFCLSSHYNLSETSPPLSTVYIVNTEGARIARDLMDFLHPFTKLWLRKANDGILVCYNM